MRGFLSPKLQPIYDFMLDNRQPMTYKEIARGIGYDFPPGWMQNLELRGLVRKFRNDKNRPFLWIVRGD